MFTAVTGVSGSGKSTLVNEILYKAVSNKLHRARMRPGAHKRIRGLEHLDKIISVDQSHGRVGKVHAYWRRVQVRVTGPARP